MIKGLFIGGAALLAALPGTNNYKLHDYGFGSGGGSMGSSNYSLEGLAGELSGQTLTSTNYGLKPGLLGSRLAALPDAPTWENGGDWYNKLRLIIDPTGNPDDATFAVAISTDNFATTQYVQFDNTVGSSLGSEDFRTYADWGAASGINVIGLQPGTEYTVKVKARHGEFTETGFGREAAAETSELSLVFDIDIAATDTETSSPYVLDFGSVAPGNVTDSPSKIWLDLESNAENGVFVYGVSDNEGLASAATGYVIGTTSGDLDSLGEGVGARGDGAGESAGGPLAFGAQYDNGGNIIGAIDSQFRLMLSSSGPVNGGRASFLLKLKTSLATPAATDYVDIYTMIATAGF